MQRIPEKTNLRIKKEDKGFVVFNLETSGFHLISDEAKELLDKVDGKKSLDDLAKIFAEKKGEDLDKVKKDISEYLEKLEERKIIKWKN